MTYETAGSELFDRFPEWRAEYARQFDYMGKEFPPYVVFGSLLIPTLEGALERHELGGILSICAYLEDAAEASDNDPRLRELLKVEVGEWLGGAANEELLSPWLGPRTKQICGYVDGLAKQRGRIRADKQRNGLFHRIASHVKSFLKA